jgi:hypothetical protein
VLKHCRRSENVIDIGILVVRAFWKFWKTGMRDTAEIKVTVIYKEHDTKTYGGVGDPTPCVLFIDIRM